MRETIEIKASEIAPSVEHVLSSQGIPAEAKVTSRTTELAREAISGFKRLASPHAIIAEIALDDFMTVFEGEGNNAERTPLEEVFSSADSMALFSVTVGEAICAEIRRLFERADYARGAMLDSSASEGTELLAGEIEKWYCRYLIESERLSSSQTAMRFSPGYCGWNVSGQRRLFEALKPDRIGISLSDSCLMQPLKSISGVIVAGEKSIFNFDDDYEVCGDCRTHSCRERISAAQQR